MGRSKGGRHSKNKGKPKLNNSDTINQNREGFNSKPEGFGYKLDLSHLTKITNTDPRGKHPDSFISNALIVGRSRYADKDLALYFRIKLEGLYNDAKAFLKKSGYNKLEIEAAMLHNGHLHGPMDLLNNILLNSIAFLEQNVKASAGPLKDMSELYTTTEEAMIDSVIQAHPGMKRSDAMWDLLLRNWGDKPLATKTSHLQSGVQIKGSIESEVKGASASDSSSAAQKVQSESPMRKVNSESRKFAPGSSSVVKKVPSESSGKSPTITGTPENVKFTPDLVSCRCKNLPILTTIIERDIPVTNQASGSSNYEPAVGYDILALLGDSPYEACHKRWSNRNPDDPKFGMIVNLVKDITHLQHKAKEYKDWAEQKEIASEKLLNKVMIELKTLRAERVNVDQLKKQIMSAEESCRMKLMAAGKTLRNANCEVSFITDAVRRLEVDNAKIKADIEAYKLNASETNAELNAVLKREKRCLKKLASTEKQASNLSAQCEQEKQRQLQLQEEVFQAEKEVEEAEIKWKQEIKEKKLMFARLAEETKFTEVRRAYWRAQLLKSRQEVDTNMQLARDKRKRLEDELALLRISHQSRSISFVEGNLSSNSIEARSLESSAQSSNSHRKCMICLENEVLVVFLPCTHQVVCFHCYGVKSGAVDGRCPCCQVAIKQGIRVYGPSL